MPLLNVICPICTDTFKDSDDVYSTSCGHLFHFNCMNDWQRRGTSCPQCRQYNPTTHKLYLSFDETDENQENREELELKLKTSNEKITQLLLQNSETETNFMKLQEQYTTAARTNTLLKQRISQMQDSEENFMRLQGQYTDSSELIKVLEDRINQLFVENEGKARELELKAIEIESLKTGNGANQGTLPDSVLKQRINILEQKLKNMASELQKEINTSTKLSIEKMKLESIINHIRSEKAEKSVHLKNNAKKNEVCAKQLTLENGVETVNNKPNFKQKEVCAKQLPLENDVKTVNKPNFKQNRRNQKGGNRAKPASVLNEDQADSRNKRVIIKDLPVDPTTPLSLIVLNLAAKINITISESDLVKVSHIDNNVEKNGKSDIVVEFKTSKLKELFLARKKMLKKYPSTEPLRIREYMDEEVLELYNYAKDKLKGNGFDCVFCANNTVFAKKDNKILNAQIIRSKSDVDNMLSSNKEEKSAVIDEFYYQIV